MSSSTTAACSTTACDAPQHSATLSVATVGDAPQRSAACARSRAAGDLGPRPFAIPRRRVALREGCLSPRPTMRVVVGDGHIRAYRPSRAPAHNLCSFAEPVMRAYRTHRVLPGGRAVARAVASWHTCLSQVVLLLCGREAACMRYCRLAGVSVAARRTPGAPRRASTAKRAPDWDTLSNRQHCAGGLRRV